MRLTEAIADNSSELPPRRYIVDVVGDLPVILMEIDPQTAFIVKSYIHGADPIGTNGQILVQHYGGQADERYFYLHDRHSWLSPMTNRCRMMLAKPCWRS